MPASETIRPPVGLRDVVRRAQRAWWGAVLARLVVVALGTAALAGAAAWLYAWGTGRPSRPWADGALSLPGLAPLPLPLPVLVGAASFLVGVVAALCLAPSPLRVARHLDRRLGLAQRLSTAWEVAARTGPGGWNALERALLRETERVSLGMDVASAWRSPRAARASLSTAAVASALIALSLVVEVPERNALVADPLAAPTLAEIETLGRVARLLEQAAEREESGYLRAVAASFDELRLDLERGAVDGEQRDRRLAELTRHLVAAANDVGGAFADAVNAAVAGLPEAGPPEQARSDVAPGSGEPARPALPEELAHGAKPFFDALGTLAERLEQSPTGSPRARASGGNAVPEGFYGGVLNAQTDPNATAPEQAPTLRGEGAAGGNVAGAAERSTDGAGDAAGGGRALPPAGSDGFLDLEFEAATLAALPDAERGEGRTTELEVVPATRLHGDAALGLAGPRVFDRADEAAFTEHAVGSAYRQVVSRYFTPNQDPDERRSRDER